MNENGYGGGETKFVIDSHLSSSGRSRATCLQCVQHTDAPGCSNLDVYAEDGCTPFLMLPRLRLFRGSQKDLLDRLGKEVE